ncbi:cation-transporting P-type ATPase [Clostridium septicum]|uniref:P-type ATPase n=1 Tax=Clostridium septicum TaxID=1504 RepID=UPI00272EC3F2|nr:cation-transporting P-type ATPase [Clostridium septicum]WLF68478.1 cation-transporting P-type ATPase [Clostridium septicum]
MKSYYGASSTKLVESLESDINKGLSADECLLRRDKYGDNKIDTPGSIRRIGILKSFLKEKYVYFYFIIIGIFILNKFNIMAIITSLLFIYNLIFKIYYEFTKAKEIEILQSLNTSQVSVLRDGIERIIEAEELVKGDIVRFRKNSFISADIRIIESEGLKVDERNVTGESLLKDKYETKLDGSVASLGEIHNMLFRGSVIKEGNGIGIVVETGRNTRLGKMLTVINNSKLNKRSLFFKVENIIYKICICLILVQVIFTLVLPGSFKGKSELFFVGIFCIITIALPNLISKYTKETKRRLLLDGYDLINFSALDSVKDIKVIFLEKTGTITKRELYLEKIYTNEEIIEKGKIDIKDINNKRLLDISMLCNNAKYNGDTEWSKGNMLEVAYIKFARERRLDKLDLERKNRRKFEVARDSSKKIYTTINKGDKGYRANTRGTLESVLEVCTHILVNGIERELTSEDINKIKMIDMIFKREGLVTDAFAYRSFNYEPSRSENIESNLVFVGLAALSNPLVDGITVEIEEIKEKGVLPIIFTDENKISGEILGREVGLIKSSKEVISGIELQSLGKDEFYKVISRTKVFCRLTPALKASIVNVFREDGFKIACEGETLGELPIVNLADFSVAKGEATGFFKKSCDVYSDKGIISAFNKLTEEGKTLFNGINNAVSIYVLGIIAELFALNFNYLLSDKIIFKQYNVLLMNFLLLTPIILLNMEYRKVDIKKHKVLLELGLISVLVSGAIFILPEENEFALFMIIGGILIFNTLLNSKISFRNINRGNKLLLLIILIYALIGGFIYFLNGAIYSTSMIAIIIETIFTCIVGDIIIKRWQNL